MCDAMRWAHLPMPGGLYDQNPDLLDKFMYIFNERSKEQEREQRRQAAKNQRGGNQKLGSARGVR